VIKVEDTRTKPFPDFELVKDQVRTYVIQKSQSDQVAKLRESAKIEKLDAPAPAPSPVPAPRR
jgi:peptidyl-prolyl cis-trans isomerase C